MPIHARTYACLFIGREKRRKEEAQEEETPRAVSLTIGSLGVSRPSSVVDCVCFVSNFSLFFVPIVATVTV